MAKLTRVDITNRASSSSFGYDETIDITQLRRSLPHGVIAPAAGSVPVELANEHTAEPIKSVADINRISDYFIERGRYRDNMLFIVGINFGLRVSDLLSLRFSHIINDDFSFKTIFPILEKKTKNTRKVRKNRYIAINDAVMDAVTLYLYNNNCKLDDYMFRSESNHGKSINQPISRMTVDRILKEAANNIHLDIKVSSHTLRKTFAYHQMLMSGNDPRKLLLLQKMFGHSSAVQTLEYIGITKEEIEDAYLNLNLGSRDTYPVDSVLGETVISA